MKLILGITVAATLAGLGLGMCPNKCNGNGACGAWDRCTCYDGFLNADCSGRLCPQARAWGDDTSATGKYEHWLAECSNKGDCDRESGVCECIEGFEGSACQRMTCSNDCNGHGACKLMGTVNSAYTAWDAEMVQLCVCDPGWEGTLCNKRVCKLGDDPMSVYDASGSQTETPEEQAIQISAGTNVLASADFILTYTDWKGETYTTHPIAFPATAIAIEEALVALPNNVIPSVTVTAVENTGSQDYTYTVTFSDAETAGDQPALVVGVAGCIAHGCQPVYTGVYHTASNVVGNIFAVSNTEADGTGERVECSNRGLCNSENGLCECFEGYYGEACNMQTVLM